MGAIRVIQKPENGLLIIPVPDDMREEILVIDFRPARETEPGQQKSLAETSKAFFEKLNRVKTNFNEEDYNVYEQ